MDKKYETEPMTKEQYEHITALFFEGSNLKKEGSYYLAARAPYRNYLEACEQTSLI